MHKIHVSFSSWERKAQGSVTPTVSNFFDGKTAGCSVLTPWYEEETGTPEYSRWRYKPSRCGGQYLHGPASLLYDRSIVYPCQSRRCQIACPYFGCRGYLVKNLSAETLTQNQKTLLEHGEKLSQNICALSWQEIILEDASKNKN